MFTFVELFLLPALIASPAAEREPVPSPRPTPAPTRSIFDGLQRGKTIVLPSREASPTPTPTIGLADWAKRMKSEGRRRTGGGAVSATSPDTRLRLVDFDVLEGPDRVEVRGVVVNISRARLHVVLVVEGLLADGTRASSTVTSASGKPIQPGGRAFFSGLLPLVVPETVTARAAVSAELVGTFETASDRRASACLSFDALLPTDSARAAESIEVRARNTCAESVPPERTWFRLVIRNAVGDLVAQRTATFSEPIPAGETGRRQVTIRVPAGARVSVAPYDGAH